MEAKSWRKNHGRVIMEGGVMDDELEEELWRRNHGVEIMEEKSWRRNH